MDDTRPPGASGHVDPTPEARPLSSTGPTQRPEADAQATGPGGSQPSSGTTDGQGSGPRSAQDRPPLIPEDRTDDIGRDVAERLKPVAEVAEGIAAKAVDLSAKGLTRLSAILEQRRRQRESGQRDR